MANIEKVFSKEDRDSRVLAQRKIIAEATTEINRIESESQGLRIVDVMEFNLDWKDGSDDPKFFPRKKFLYRAYFHQFGVDYDEYEEGPVMFSTAIVELESGDLESIPVTLIRFTNRTNL